MFTTDKLSTKEIQRVPTKVHEHYIRMDPGLRSTGNGDFLQNVGWDEDSILNNLPANLTDQYSHLQRIFELASSTTTTNTTPSSVSGSVDQVKQHDLPIRNICDSTTTCTPLSSSGQITPFQNEDTRTQETTATGRWRSGVYQFSGTDRGGFSPAADFDVRHKMVRRNEGAGYKKPTRPSQVVKVDDLTSIGTWTHTLDNFHGGGFANSWLSERKRLPVEPRNHVRGWPCPICNQVLKRRDYIKPHVKRKHPECYDRSWCTPSSAPEQSIAAPANFASTYEDLLIPGGVAGEERPSPVVIWNFQSNLHNDSFRSDDAFPGGSITPQKRSLDRISLDDRDILDGSENEPSTRLKTTHNQWARSLACPFYKHYPFQHRKCLALSLRRPKDVKQHIYRSHTQPEFYCARCYQIFDTATDRDTHWRDRLCDRLDSPVSLKFQGITENQRKLLNEKSPRELSVEAQWFQIYATIFPVSELPRSPYVGNDLEEMVPLLRERWETQGYKITARAELGHHQLSFAMDLFFRSLEGESLEPENDNSTLSAQSLVGNDSQRGTWSLFSV